MLIKVTISAQLKENKTKQKQPTVSQQDAKAGFKKGRLGPLVRLQLFSLIYNSPSIAFLFKNQVPIRRASPLLAPN